MILPEDIFSRFVRGPNATTLEDFKEQAERLEKEVSLKFFKGQMTFEIEQFHIQYKGHSVALGPYIIIFNSAASRLTGESLVYAFAKDETTPVSKQSASIHPNIKQFGAKNIEARRHIYKNMSEAIKVISEGPAWLCTNNHDRHKYFADVGDLYSFVDYITCLIKNPTREDHFGDLLSFVPGLMKCCDCFGYTEKNTEVIDAHGNIIFVCDTCYENVLKEIERKKKELKEKRELEIKRRLEQERKAKENKKIRNTKKLEIQKNLKEFDERYEQLITKNTTNYIPPKTNVYTINKVV